MKLATLTTLTLALLAFPLPARAGEDTKKDKAIDAEVKGDALTLKGQKLILPCAQAAVEKVLGKPSRTVKGFNTVLVWDDLGIFVYQDKTTKKVIMVAFVQGTLKAPYAPKSKFAGKLTVDGAAVTAKSDVAALNKAKKGGAFQQGKAFKEAWTLKHKGSASVSVVCPNEKGKGVDRLEVTNEGG
jgi:hypothetical protein